MHILGKFSSASVQDGVQVRTLAGALLTLGASLLILVLLVTELKVYTTTTTEHHLTIDSQAAQLETVKISLHATFFHLPCSDINLDMEATRGDGDLSEDTVEKLPAGEGCTLRGDLTVPKVGGNFHVSTGTLGMSGSPIIQLMGGLILNGGGVKGANISHAVHSLRFGENFIGQTSPLQDVVNIVPTDVGQYQFHIKVIPTIYRPLRGAPVYSNSYSMHEQFVRLDLLSAMQAASQPGIYFNYDFYPVMVELVETKPSFLHFLTRVCGIIGGIVAAVGVLDSIIHRANEQLKKAD